MSFDLFTLPPAPKPAPAPAFKLAGYGIPLRWCQRQDDDALMHAIESGERRLACVASTGYGKTAVEAELAGRLLPSGKVLCLMDRAHLVHQGADEFERHLGVDVGRVADGECVGIGRRIIVATVQAMYTPDRSGRPLYDYPQFDDVRAVILDEGHKFFADCYRGVADHFVEGRGAVVAGFTATPVAANGAKWSSFFTWTAGADGPCMRSVGWCTRNGYLVPMRQAFVRSSLDISGIYGRLATPATDTPDGADDAEQEERGDELSRVLLDLLRVKGERAAAEFAAGVVEVLGGRRAIVFSPARVDAAKLLASWINAVKGIKCEAVWGGRPDKMDILDRFRRGNPDALVGVNMLMEGFDAPTVSAVFMCRLLKQWRLVAQCVGRALRPHPECIEELNEHDGEDQADERRAILARSAKPDALIADLVGIDDRIVQASAVDVLYADQPEAVRAEVAELFKARQFKARPDGDEPPESDDSALEQARTNLLNKQHEQLAEMARRRGMAGDITADVTVSYGPGSAPTTPLPSVPTPRAGATPGEKAMFVAVAVQYDAARAADIAERTARHVLKGMTFSMRKKLEKDGGKPDWGRARRAFPEWAAEKDRTRKAGAK